MSSGRVYDLSRLGQRFCVAFLSAARKVTRLDDFARHPLTSTPVSPPPPHKKVAIPKMPKDEREAALQEAKLLASMRHPNIVSCVESFVDKNTKKLCIVQVRVARFPNPGTLFTHTRLTLFFFIIRSGAPAGTRTST